MGYPIHFHELESSFGGILEKIMLAYCQQRANHIGLSLGLSVALIVNCRKKNVN